MPKAEVLRSSELCFVGDLVSPAWAPASLNGFRSWLGTRSLVANLEGPLLADFDHAKPRFETKYSLASAPALIKQLPDACLLSVANNHYEDFAAGAFAASGSASFIGTADAGSHASYLGNTPLVLFTMAFPATDPALWRSRKISNFLRPTEALRRLERIRADNPDATLIVYVHWGYEYSTVPYPADRAWARRAIEAGADLIVGHHPHIQQPLEDFGSGKVAYSLGNFYLPNGVHFGKTLTAPAPCKEGLALCYDGITATLHKTVPNYETGDVSVEDHVRADIVDPPFKGMTDRQYKSYFRDGMRAGWARLPRLVPVLESYHGLFGLKQTAQLFWQDSRQTARDLLISAAIHKPHKTQAAPDNLP